MSVNVLCLHYPFPQVMSTSYSYRMFVIAPKTSTNVKQLYRTKNFNYNNNILVKSDRSQLGLTNKISNPQVT